MLVIKKRVICVAVLLCVIMCGVLWFGLGKEESVECFTPATNKRVIVDFGHGLPDRRHKF